MEVTFKKDAVYCFDGRTEFHYNKGQTYRARHPQEEVCFNNAINKGLAVRGVVTIRTTNKRRTPTKTT